MYSGNMSIMLVFLFLISTITPLEGASSLHIDLNFAQNQVDFEYGLMMDAGSSKTQLHIYVWDKDDRPFTIPDVEQAPIGEVPWSMKVKPGISSFANDPDKVGESLAPLIEYAKSKIPSNKHSSTFLFLKATAGMRLLPKDQQEAIMENVRKYLKKTPFVFDPSWAQVISGQEEGVFGWVSVNYLLSTIHEGANVTYGALDMGGASTQITFHSTKAPLAHSFDLSFNSHVEFELYSYSFLKYGNDQAREQLEQSLINKAPNSTVVYDPCYPSGYTTYFLNEQEGTVTNYTIVGSSDFDACKNGVINILKLQQPCEIPGQNCSIDGIYQPPLPPNMIFYGFSGYYYVYDFFDLQKNASLSELQDAARSYCSLNWQQIQQKYDVNKNPFLMNYCFMGTYVQSVLHNAYNFSMNEQRIIFEDVLNEVEIGWTIGAMLYEASRIPGELRCLRSTSCGECLDNIGCGWCGRTRQCLPSKAHDCPVNMRTSSCPKSTLNETAIILIGVLGSLAVIALLLGACLFIRKKQNKATEERDPLLEQTNQMTKLI